jgi:hypothetical protein
MRGRNRAGSYSGAPRPMKLGTIASPWRYDAPAHSALQSANLRRPAILRYALWAALLLISPGYPSMAAFRERRIATAGMIAFSSLSSRAQGQFIYSVSWTGE